MTGIRRGGSTSTSDFSQGGGDESPFQSHQSRGTDRHDTSDLDATRGSEGDPGRLSVATDDQGYLQRRTPSPRPSAASHSSSAYPLSPTLKALYPHDHHDSQEEIREGEEQDSTLRRRGAKDRSSTSGGAGGATVAAQPFIPRSTAINRTDLIASAERIFSRYLMAGADKEIYLPASLRITEFPISSSVLPAVTHPDYDQESRAQALVPDMFHHQKEFVYRSMEMDSFPRFLRAKAFGNLTGISALVRLGLGLVALWAGLATGFSLIFLDTKPKVTRLWVSLSVSSCFPNSSSSADTLSVDGVWTRTAFVRSRLTRGFSCDDTGHPAFRSRGRQSRRALVRPRSPHGLHGTFRDGECPPALHFLVLLVLG